MSPNLARVISFIDMLNGWLGNVKMHDGVVYIVCDYGVICVLVVAIFIAELILDAWLCDNMCLI